MNFVKFLGTPLSHRPFTLNSKRKLKEKWKKAKSKWQSEQTVCCEIVSYVLRFCLVIVLFKWVYQARIQRFKEVSQTDYVPGFPLAAAWISRFTSVIIYVELSTFTHWVLISAKSVEDCILEEKHHNLQSILQNINKFSVGHTKPIHTNTKNSRSHEFCPEFCGIF